MAGLIAVATRDFSRFTDFNMSLLFVDKPDGTRVSWSRGLDVAKGLNDAIRSVPDAEWVWILADDHTFEHDTLMRLLAHNRPVVVPLVASRHAPCGPVLFKQEVPEKPGSFRVYQWADVPPNGLFTVAGAGTAGMLVRREVLNTIGDPWFEAGRVTPDQTSEDMWFSHKLVQAGIPVYADCDTRMGHLTVMNVLPTKNANAEWQAAIYP